jgi:hypothetical protein
MRVRLSLVNTKPRPPLRQLLPPQPKNVLLAVLKAADVVKDVVAVAVVAVVSTIAMVVMVETVPLVKEEEASLVVSLTATALVARTTRTAVVQTGVMMIKRSLISKRTKQ